MSQEHKHLQELNCSKWCTYMEWLRSSNKKLELFLCIYAYYCCILCFQLDKTHDAMNIFTKRFTILMLFSLFDNLFLFFIHYILMVVICYVYEQLR